MGWLHTPQPHFYKLICVNCGRALADALKQRPQGCAADEVVNVNVARQYAKDDAILREYPRATDSKDDDDLVLVTYDDSLPADAAASARLHNVNVRRKPNVVKQPLPTAWSFLHLVAVIIDYCFKAKSIAELDDDDTLWAPYLGAKLVGVVIDRCFKAAKVPGLYNDPKTEWASYLYCRLRRSVDQGSEHQAFKSPTFS